MKPETDPISEDEWLLRRVHSTRYQKRDLPFLSPTAFEPRTTGDASDVDGISLYREACLSNPEDILTGVPPEKLAANGIVRVSVAKLRELGLTVEPVRDDIVGHCVIPELRVETFKAKKAEVTKLMGQLAEATSAQVAAVRIPPCLLDPA